jgi:hypothetical protein
MQFVFLYLKIKLYDRSTHKKKNIKEESIREEINEKVNIFFYTRYFTSDNVPDAIENATHNTFAKLM